MNLTNLRLMSEGDKAFEKEMIEISLSYLPEMIALLYSEIVQLDFNGIKLTAHKLKSSIFILGIDDESILNKLELEEIEDLDTLKELHFRLENIILDSLKSLEIELNKL